VSAAGTLSSFSTDFDSGLPVEFGGAGLVQDVQGLSGKGFDGNQFGGKFLRNDSTLDVDNPFQAVATTLTLTNLPTHTSIDLSFLLAILDSWDGYQVDGDVPHLDTFNVTVDDSLVFSQVFSNFDILGAQTYNPPGVSIVRQEQLGFGQMYPESAYDMSLDPSFISIPHTASTLTIRWFASGSYWQGGYDESWAIDNVKVVLNGTHVANPEPTSLVIFGGGLCGVAVVGMIRRRKSSVA
jgi:hypothetical protein